MVVRRKGFRVVNYRELPDGSRCAAFVGGRAGRIGVGACYRTDLAVPLLSAVGAVNRRLAAV